MSGPYSADLTAVGYGLQSTLDTYQAPNRWLYSHDKDFNVKWDKIAKKAHTGTVASSRFFRRGKGQLIGKVTYPFAGNIGAPLLKCVFGANGTLAQLAADTVKTATPIVTANGISTVTLTNTGAATYTQYAWVRVGTGTTSELRQTLTIANNTATSTVLTMPALVANAAGAAGTAVRQLDQIGFTNAVTGNTLPLVSVEDARGSYTKKLKNGMVEKYAIKAGKDDVVCTTDLFFSGAGPVTGTVTTPAPTAGEVADEGSFFTQEHTMITVAQDPLQAGGSTATSAQQMNSYIEDFSMEIDNGLVKKTQHDLGRYYRAYRGSLSGKFDYQYINASARQSEFEDYLDALVYSPQPITFGAAVNTSTTSTDAWKAVGFAVPTAYLTQADEIQKVGDLLVAKITGEFGNATAVGDTIVGYVCNTDAPSAY